MAGSCRSDLKNGYMKSWEGKLGKAIGLIEEVCSEVWECALHEGQYDNSMDDGILLGELRSVVSLIGSELPKDKKEGGR